jgi:hypothetical protein
MYNPVGRDFYGPGLPVMSGLTRGADILKARDEMFQIALNATRGEPYSLDASVFSDTYTLDLGGSRIFSVGADGEPDTEDDVVLPINPRAFEGTQAIDEEAGME